MDKQSIAYKILNVLLWIVQLGLAAMFITWGFLKIIKPIQELAYMLPWVNNIPDTLVRFIGIAELIGGLGLILPSLLRAKRFLTPLAAIGIFVLMLSAFVYHLGHNEIYASIINSILGIVALFIACGRYLLDRNNKG